MLLYLLFVYLFLYTIKSGVIEEEFNYYNGEINIYLYIVVMIICSLKPLLSFLAVYFGIRYTIKKAEKKNLTYNAIKDISYYRENFNDLTPFEISILANLNVEEKKDVIATILWFQNKKYIDIKNNQIIYNEELNLNDKDKCFLTFLKTKDLGYLEAYKNMSYQDLKQRGYIVENTDLFNIKHMFKSIGAILLLPFAIIILVLINVFLVKNLIVEEIIVIAILLLSATITYKKVSLFFVGYANRKNRFKRTNLGEEQTELIHSLQNFIHDFSNLKDADKEQIILWEDFLIYAIVLEENDKIVADIEKSFNYNNQSFIDYRVSAKIKVTFSN